MITIVGTETQLSIFGGGMIPAANVKPGTKLTCVVLDKKRMKFRLEVVEVIDVKKGTAECLKIYDAIFAKGQMTINDKFEFVPADDVVYHFGIARPKPCKRKPVPVGEKRVVQIEMKNPNAIPLIAPVDLLIFTDSFINVETDEEVHAETETKIEADVEEKKVEVQDNAEKKKGKSSRRKKKKS